MADNKPTEIKPIEMKVNKVRTGPPDNPLPQPEAIEVPECTLPANSFKILRSVLMKSWAVAKAVYNNVGRIEAYWILVTNRPDLTVTDIIIPRHTASAASVTAEPDAIDEVRSEIRARNAQITDKDNRWRAVGWGHSHGSMSVFFSGTDWNNQKGILDSTGIVTERWGVKYLTVYGMTVNVNEEVYSEILSRMVCTALIRQEGASLDVIEDVDENDQEYKDKLYQDYVPEVKAKVTAYITRSAWKSKGSYGRTKSITSYSYDYSDTNIASDISADDLISEIRKKTQNSKEILLTIQKGLNLKKKIQGVGGKKVQNTLLNMIKRARKMILESVENIIYGEKEDEEEKEKVQTTFTPSSKSKYEVIIDIVNNHSGRAKFSGIEEFVTHVKPILSDDLYKYVVKNKSYMLDKLEAAEISLKATPEEVVEDKKNAESKVDKMNTEESIIGRLGAGEIPSKKTKMTKEEISKYLMFIINTTGISDQISTNIRGKLNGGLKVREITMMSPVTIAATFGESKKSQLIRDKTRYYIKINPVIKTVSINASTSDDLTKRLSERMIEEKKKKEELFEEYVSYLIKNVALVMESDRDRITSFLKRGNEIEDILTLPLKEIQKIVSSTMKVAENVITATYIFLDLDEEQPEEIFSKEFAYLRILTFDEVTRENLAEYITENDLNVDNLASINIDELMDIIACCEDDAMEIIEASKNDLMKLEPPPSPAYHIEWRVEHFIDPIPLSRTTKEKVASYIEEDHFIYELLDMSDKELKDNFECQEWEIELIRGIKGKKEEESTTESEEDIPKEIVDGTGYEIHVYVGGDIDDERWSPTQAIWDEYKKIDGMMGRINDHLYRYDITEHKWLLYEFDKSHEEEEETEVEEKPDKEVETETNLPMTSSLDKPEESRDEKKIFIDSLKISPIGKSAIATFFMRGEITEVMNQLLRIYKRQFYKKTMCPTSDREILLTAIRAYLKKKRNSTNFPPYIS